MRFIALLLIALGAAAIAWAIRVFLGGADGTDSGDLYIAVGIVCASFGAIVAAIGTRLLRR